MKAYLIITQILYFLFLMPWFLIWAFSFMVFDNGFGLGNVTFFLVITFYPIAIILCSILAWIFRVKKQRFAIVINLLPSLWIIAYLSLMTFI
ncbi:hypothetical protein MHB48_17730 [Psychrobacillus sp. FSL H8-0483]|uniref:hypothetical protein n=1 Tax=Psychrobacillus sp. FSL H8-0483 TaxID=2921389 RepID=UPI00315A6F87